MQVTSFLYVNYVTGIVFLATNFLLRHLHCFAYSSTCFTVTSFVFVNCITGIALLASPFYFHCFAYSLTPFIQVNTLMFVN